MLPFATVSVLPLLLLSVAPLGILLSLTELRLLVSPVRPLTAMPRLSAIAWPADPDTAPGATVGVSGLTVPASLMLAVLVLPSPSTSVAVRVKLMSLVVLIFRLDSVQLLTSTAVLVLVAVKLWPPAPSLSTAPTGIALTTSDCRLFASPDRLLTVAAKVPSASAVPSVAAVAAPQLTVGASGLTVTGTST